MVVAYIVCIRERYCVLSLVCKLKMAIGVFEVKVDVQKGP